MSTVPETNDSRNAAMDESPSNDCAKVLVMLCTYNERGNLPDMLNLLKEHLPEADVLVVDDNSPDGTAEVVKQFQELNPQVHLMQRAGKLGLGTAVRDGMRWCLERDYEFLLNLDADHSHNPASTPAMLEKCQSPDVDVSIGSRYIEGGGFPGLAWHRVLISRCLNGYATRLLRLPVTDCSGSFRCYSTSALREIELDRLTCDGYGFLEEILVALHRTGARLSEVPIQFETRMTGKSKLSFKDIVGALSVIHKMAFRR